MLNKFKASKIYWLLILSFSALIIALGSLTIAINNNQVSQSNQINQELAIAKSSSTCILPNQKGQYNVYLRQKPDLDLQMDTKLALDIWQHKTGIKFNLVNNPKNAQITIIRKRGEIGDQSIYLKLGETKIVTTGRYAKSGKIVLSQRAMNECETSETKVLLHEIGHALGLRHRHTKNDIMQPVVDNHNKISHFDAIKAQRIHQIFTKQ